MTTVRELHDKAMTIAQSAMVAYHMGDLGRFKALSHDAFRLEEEAAQKIAATIENEPTRSILYRSAANMAYNAQDYEAAEKLAIAGLAGYATGRVTEELRDVLKRIYFRPSVAEGDSLLAVQRPSKELHLSFKGGAVAYGLAISDVIIGRIHAFQKLFYRTLERLSDLPYRTSGDVDKKLKGFSVTLSSQPPSSFAVSFSIVQIGEINERKDLPVKVVDEIMNCLRLLNDGQENQLQDLFSNPYYFANFLELVYDIAPDGDEVSGITISNLDNFNLGENFGFTRTREDIAGYSQYWLARNRNQRVTISGLLKNIGKMDKKNGVINVITNDGSKHRVIVLPKDYSTIVSFVETETRVTLEARYDSRGKLVLENIINAIGQPKLDL